MQYAIIASPCHVERAMRRTSAQRTMSPPWVGAVSKRPTARSRQTSWPNAVSATNGKGPPPGMRRGQHSIALIVDILLIRRAPYIRLCPYPLTLFPSKRASGIKSST